MERTIERIKLAYSNLQELQAERRAEEEQGGRMTDEIRDLLIRRIEARRVHHVSRLEIFTRSHKECVNAHDRFSAKRYIRLIRAKEAQIKELDWVLGWWWIKA